MPAPRPPRPITASYLEWLSTRYLERYFTSTAHFRRLLMQRVKRAAEAGLTPRDEGERLVDAELERLVRIGALDDAKFAEDKANALRRRGGSSAKIRATLQAKSLRAEQIDAVVSPAHDAAAAVTWARKRRLGPWRRGPVTPETRRSELAKLARAGFSYAVAKRVVDAESEDDLALR